MPMMGYKDFIESFKKKWYIFILIWIGQIILIMALLLGFMALLASCTQSPFDNITGQFFGNDGSTSNNSSSDGNGSLDSDCFVKLVKQANPNISTETATKYKGYIEDAASKMNINAAAIAAVAEKESTFTNHTGSGDGKSRGVMQIQTKVGANGDCEVWYNEAVPLAKKYGNVTISDIMNEQHSFLGGAAILRRNLDDFKHDYYTAFAAYNAGESGASNGKAGQAYASVVMTKYNKYQKCITSSGTTNNTNTGNKKIIYLHWTAGDYMRAYPDEYDYTILGDGTVVKGSGGHHTQNRNKNSIGIAVAAGCSPSNSSIYPSDDVLGTKTFGGCGRPIKQVQYDKLIELTAQIAKENNIPVDKNHIMSHAEAASMKDYAKNLVSQVSNPNQAKCVNTADDAKAIKLGLPHCNYGPSSWKDGWPGGCRNSLTRWEYWEHEDAIRSAIKAKMSK